MENGVHLYYPEMGGKAPKCTLEAELAHYGKHYFITTSETLSGRGIEFIQAYTKKDGYPRRIGRNFYKVTLAAFEKLEKQYSISYEMLLD